MILLVRNTWKYLFMMAICYWSHCYTVSHPTTGASRKLLTLNKRVLPDVLGGGSSGFCWGTWDQVAVYVAARIKAGLGDRHLGLSQPWPGGPRVWNPDVLLPWRQFWPLLPWALGFPVCSPWVNGRSQKKAAVLKRQQDNELPQL